MIRFSDESRRKITNMLADDQLKIDELKREKEELEKKLDALNKKFERMVDRRDAVMDAYGIFLDYSSRTFELLDNY